MLGANNNSIIKIRNNLKTINMSDLISNGNIQFTYTANTGLGDGGNVEIYGDKMCGRIVVNTGTDCDGLTACRINTPEGDNFASDAIQVNLWDSIGTFFEVVAQGEDSNGFDIYAKNAWQDNTSYEFKYQITQKMQ